jgi:adenylate cyclase
MSNDPERDAIDAARARNERAVTWAVFALALLGIGISSWRSLTVEAEQGIRILVFAVVVAFLYGASLARKTMPSRTELWIRVTIEVSASSIVLWMDGQAGAAYAISAATSMLYPFAIVLAALRLLPRLTLYATVLAIVQHLVLYLITFQDPAIALSTGGLPMVRLYQELVFRLFVMAFMGGISTWMMISFRRELNRAGEEDRLRRAFGSYVDRRVVRRVLAGDLRIAPERREVTVLFVDIRNFTRLSETRDAAEVFRLLSGTLDAFSQEVQKQGGIVNKYLGDGLLAIFGAPEPLDDHARRAVRCALNIVAEADARAADGRFPGLEVGVGIHGGPVVVGDLGGERREFTAIGDVVNVASRIEAANKELGTHVLATGYVVDTLGGTAELKKMPPIAVRGREAPVEVFEITDLEQAEPSFNKVFASSAGVLRA